MNPPRPIFGQSDDGGPFAGVFAFLPIDKVIFGPGVVGSLAAEIDRVGGRRVLVVTGTTLATRTGLVEKIRALLGDRCVGVFSDTVQHVSRASVLAATDMARELDVDALVSFGGGSPIDTAKAVAMCLAEDVRTGADLDRLHFRMEPDGLVAPPITGTLIPHVAISTTLSAGEFTGYTGITDPDRRHKDAYGTPAMTPRVVFLDPELATATPSWLWASTGMRAIDHCVESVYSIRHQPFADALCLRALEMLVAALPRAAADPSDVEALGACQVAMWMSIFSLHNIPAGMSHGIGHQLGARCDLPHGVCSAIMLPEVMDYNRPVTAARQRLVAEALGVDVAGMSDDAAAAAAAQALRDLVSQLGIRNRLSDWGVTPDDLPLVASDAVQDFMNATNPVPVTDAAVIEGLLRRVL
jgi:alcohol dehydrogenase class IV